MSKTGNVCLVGFSGAGKTTVGKTLAARTRKRLVDMDEEIVKREGRSIPEIFGPDNKGELHFRELERALLRKLFFSAEDVIISTGGGTFINADNRPMMLTGCYVVWLCVPLPVIRERLRDDNSRPLLKNKSLKELEEFFAQRERIYRLAPYHVDASGPPEEVTEEIMQAMKWA